MPICDSFILAVRLNTCMLGSCMETRMFIAAISVAWAHRPHLLSDLSPPCYCELYTLCACVDHVSEFDSDCYSHFVDKLPV